MDRFNRVFQKSNENTTCLLYSEMTRLVKLYAANLLNTDSIKKVGEDLKKLCFEEGDQLDKENLGIGTSTWTSVSALEEENDMKPFFEAVRGFYINTIKKIIKNFLLVIAFFKIWVFLYLIKHRLIQWIQSLG